MADPEHDVMAGILAHDPAAFETLFSRYSAVVLHQLQRMVRDTAAAEDLMQEVFLRVWQRAEQWQGHGTLHAWLVRIATNLALNHLRTVRRRREQSLAVPPSRLPEDVGQDLPSILLWMSDTTALSPEAALEQAEQRRLVWSWIDALPAEQRAALRLTHTTDMDMRTIAEMLGVPEGTVKSRLHYAIRKLIQRGREAALNWEEEGS
jgi:RNA polymerase sigma-70 factor (ECF subfamily)